MIKAESEDVIAGGSYRQHFPHVKTAVYKFKDLGYTTYPPPHAEIEDLLPGFVRVLGVDEHIVGAVKLEMAFIRRLKPAKLVYFVTPGGYMGHSASVELAITLAYNKPVYISEPIKVLGKEVPDNIEDIILKYHPPVLPLDRIGSLNGNACKSPFSKSLLTDKEKFTSFMAATRLAKGW